VAATAVEETRKLPQTILMSPMSVASQLAQLVMKMQLDIADLVNKGDATLETLFPPKDEQPEWATFDEDAADSAETGAPAESGERMTEGRFALYSTDDVGEAVSTNGQSDNAEVSAPEVATRIDYGSLTLAQLRARLQSLSVDELTELLAHEEKTKARAPFQTLLANRITRASAK
jgi:hypothetical protein